MGRSLSRRIVVYTLSSVLLWEIWNRIGFNE